MTFRNLLTHFLLVLCFSGKAQIPDFLWVKQVSGERGISLTEDGSGNIYLTGVFTDTVDFDPGPATSMLISKGSGDVFVCKYDANGIFKWAKGFGGSERDEPYSIKADQAGNVVVTGQFYIDTVDLDPGPAIHTVACQGGHDIFLVKLNTMGDFVWGHGFGAYWPDIGGAVTMDNAGNIYVSGFFEDKVDFNPGPGVFQLVSNAGQSLFVLKLNSSGNFIWAKAFVGNIRVQARSITLDMAGNILVSGYYEGVVDFGMSPLPYSFGGSVFVLKLSATGALLWARGLGGKELGEGAGVVTDSQNNVYSVGHYAYMADFDPGPATYTVGDEFTSNHRTFVWKLSAAGDFHWAQTVDGSASDFAHGIVKDSRDNVYALGVLGGGQVDFDPGPGFFFNPLHARTFIVRYDSSGNFNWVTSFTGSCDGKALHMNNNGDIYTTGTFSGRVDFNNQETAAAVYTLEPKAASDIFLHKMNQIAVTSLQDNGSIETARVFPNPSDGVFYIDHAAGSAIRMSDPFGHVIYHDTITGPHHTINVVGIKPGLYFLHLGSEKNSQVVKIVVE